MAATTSSSAVKIIRRFPPKKLHEEDYGVFTVQHGQPRTPQILQGVEDISTQLSSPLDRYTITAPSPQSPTMVYIQHKESDRARLKVAKGAISSLEDRVRVIEKEREEQDNLILQWETCDRLAQGLNDFIKDRVMNPTDKVVEDLSGAQFIWSRENRYRYLPHIFTEWWLSWAKTYHDPDDPDSEKLPSVFDSLSPSEVSNYQSRRPLPKKIDQAAAILWYSSLQDIIQLMLVYFHKRPHTRNGLQHPIPSTAFAHSFVNSNSYLNLSEKQKHKTETIINSGKRPDGSFLLITVTTPFLHLPNLLPLPHMPWV